MSNNLGCGCNCNGNGANGGSAIMIQQGDTFDLVFQYKENDTAMSLPSGYDLLVGIYDMMGKVLQVGRVSDGTITASGNDTYTLRVTHEASMKMIGTVTLEITITNDDGTIVDHAQEIVEIHFDTRKNNALI